MNTQILKRANVAAIVAVTAAVMFATSAMATAFQVPLSGETITVTTCNDVSDFSGSQQVSDLPGPDGRVSFREACIAANNTAGGQTIAFAIPVADFYWWTDVALLKSEQGAFFITGSDTTVDFTTQTTNIGDTNPTGLEVMIYNLAPNWIGIPAIFVKGNNCLIKGLGTAYQSGYGVRLIGNNNRVIGSDKGSVIIEGYSGEPIPTGNVVGGTGPGEGNNLTGVRIGGPAENNIVIGNTIIGGVDVIGSTQYGVIARNNRIGGPSSAERNVISGSGYYSSEGYPVGEQVSVVDADGTIIEGNYIGTTVDGMARYPQQVGAVGVEVRDSRGTTVRGNLIAGLRSVGTNHYNGQIYGQAVYVGATNRSSYDTLVEGNTIGLAADGVTTIVTRSGITVSPGSSNYHAFGTRIASNHIAGVETTGIAIGSQENGVTLTGNSIHDSGGLGIDLFYNFNGIGGVTLNDPGDGDIGGNGLQNFPVILSAATTGSAVMVQGTLDTSPSAQFTVEFFASPSCDSSGFGEGAAFIGSTPVTTDSAGHAAFSLTLPASVAIGAKVTSTATRLSTGDTSEFSACTAVTSAGVATPTSTPVATPTSTATPTATATPIATPVATPTPTPVATPIATATPVATPAATPTPVATPIATATPVATPAATPTPVATPIATATPVATPAATPTPAPNPASKAINLSTRMRVQTGDNVGIGGFIITGTAPKHVLIRAIGPSLTGFGVPNVLADPVLELHGPGAFATMTNDNWKHTQAAEIQATGIPPTDDFESAIVATLAPGAYTAIVTGNGNTSGVALVEVYDLSQEVDSKLANISTRAFVSTGDDIVIAGFLLSDPPQAGTSDKVVVRGIGPSLTALGVGNALADPTLELRDNNGTLLVANNDWQENAVQASEITAAGLAPTNSLESAVAATLPPGLYTALLAGRNNGAGIGIVEVYDRGGTP